MLKTRLIAPYQREGVDWMTKRDTSPSHPGGILCDEMGLGKTVQVLATMVNNPKPKTLIVVPKSIMGQWADEISKFTSFTTCSYSSTNHALPTKLPDIVIVPYSVVARKPALIQAITWDRIVLDEGHEIRTASSKTHIACCELKGSIRWILTGTPVFNSMKDFVSLCAFLGLTKGEVLCFTTKVSTTYMLRRTKEDVCKFNPRLKLPPCDFELTEIEMYAEERVLYEAIYSRSQDFIKDVFKAGTQNMHNMEVLECLLRIRQCMAFPQLALSGLAKKAGEDAELYSGRSKKMETLMELIKTHPKEKALVFTHFTGEMTKIKTMLEAEGIKTFCLSGSVHQLNREMEIRDFKAAASGVFIIQIKAGGVGLNLQEATRVYITSPAWNPAVELQAIARSHRTGQTQKVVVRKLIYSGYDDLPSVEQSICALQAAKCKVCAEVLNDPRMEAQLPSSKGNLSIQTIKKIFNV